MKKLLTLTLASVLLSACGTRTVVLQQPLSVETPSTSQKPAGTATEAFVSDVISEKPDILNANGKAWLVDFGNAICTAIDEGMTFNEYVEMAFKTDTDASSAGVLARLAIKNLCPENQWFLDGAAAA